jgi:formylglycine-generating enzyme required for sulfatase activity
MTWIPGGEFTMGSDACYPAERPVDRAAVDSFWMDTRAVTTADFYRFVTDTGYRTVPEGPLGAAECPDADLAVPPRSAPVFRNPAVNVPGRDLALAPPRRVIKADSHLCAIRCVIRSGPLLARPGRRPAGGAG